jgi:hypothetical protein
MPGTGGPGGMDRGGDERKAAGAMVGRAEAQRKA